VMKATKNGRRDDAPAGPNPVTVTTWIHRKGARGVGDTGTERRMWSCLIVEGHPRLKNLSEMLLRQRD